MSLCVEAVAQPHDPIASAKAAIEIGDRFMGAGRVANACTQYELAVAFASEWWYAGYKKALCDMALGDEADAIYLLNGLSSRGRELYAPVLALARLVRTKGGDETEANRLYETAMAAGGGAVAPMVELADLLADSGLLGEAELVLKRAAYYSPGNVAVRSRLARIADRLDHVSVAEGEYRVVAVQGVNPRRDLAQLARFYQRRGKPQAAQAVMRRIGAAGSADELPEVQFPPQDDEN